jgi:hypothetical protein
LLARPAAEATKAPGRVRCQADRGVARCARRRLWLVLDRRAAAARRRGSGGCSASRTPSLKGGGQIFARRGNHRGSLEGSFRQQAEPPLRSSVSGDDLRRRHASRLPEMYPHVARTDYEKWGFTGISRSPLTDSNRRPLLTMRSETVAVGCHWLRIGVFERFSGVSHLPLVATGCARWAP